MGVSAEPPSYPKTDIALLKIDAGGDLPTSVELTDDIDGGKAAETVSFGLDGKTYEVTHSHLDAVIALIRNAADADAAREGREHGDVTTLRDASVLTQLQQIAAPAQPKETT